MPSGVYSRKLILDRFWEKVKVINNENSCWEWQGSINRKGYGWFGLGKRGNKKNPISAHRFSYMIHYGNIGDGILVCHSCDNPKCVRPSHLFLGSSSDNTQDMIMKGRNDPNRKISIEQAQEIKRSKKSNRELAEKYGVCVKTISGIRNGKSWHWREIS